jgi:hypothetical protein
MITPTLVKMSSLKTIVLTGLLLAGTSPLFAQPSPDTRPGPGAGPRPASPLMIALDLNQDGELSADELARATESLKTLDLNGDGKLTRRELQPARRPRPDGERGPGPGRNADAGAGETPRTSPKR